MSPQCHNPCMARGDSAVIQSSIVIFVDGACSGNPGPGGWGAIVATPQGEVTELGGGDRQTTNNRMEIQGTISALAHVADQPGPVAVFTDSVYVIKGITQWVWGWRNRDWKTAEGKDVANPELWKRLIALTAARGAGNKVEWHWVKGHSGIPGNERVDEIAVAYSKGARVSLYRGSLLQYDIALYDLPNDTSLPEPREIPKGPKAKAYSYLSLLGGKPERHSTWAECERRVKGQSGAKFKKAMSASEEADILRSWGVRL